MSKKQRKNHLSNKEKFLIKKAVLQNSNKLALTPDELADYLVKAIQRINRA